MSLLVCAIVSASIIEDGVAKRISPLDEADHFKVAPVIEEIPTAVGGQITFVKRYETEDGFKVLWHEWEKDEATKGFAPILVLYEESGDEKTLTYLEQDWTSEDDGGPDKLVARSAKKRCETVEIPAQYKYPTSEREEQ